METQAVQFALFLSGNSDTQTHRKLGHRKKHLFKTFSPHDLNASTCKIDVTDGGTRVGNPLFFFFKNTLKSVQLVRT